jgi:hypothetical protein
MLISFDKPSNIDGAKLVNELNNEGISVGNSKNSFSKWPIIDANNVLWLEIDEKDKTKAQVVLAAHKPSA